MLCCPTSTATDAVLAITQNGSSSLKQPGRHLILSSSLYFKALPTVGNYSKAKRDLLLSTKSPRFEKKWQPGMRRRRKNSVKMTLRNTNGVFLRSRPSLRPQTTNKIKRWLPRLGIQPMPATGYHSLRLLRTGSAMQPHDTVFSTFTGYRVLVRN